MNKKRLFKCLKDFTCADTRQHGRYRNPNPSHVVMGLKLKKCLHSPEINAINSFSGHWTVGNLYGEIHNFEASKAKGSTLKALNEFYWDDESFPIYYKMFCNTQGTHVGAHYHVSSYVSWGRRRAYKSFHIRCTESLTLGLGCHLEKEEKAFSHSSGNILCMES